MNPTNADYGTSNPCRRCGERNPYTRCSECEGKKNRRQVDSLEIVIQQLRASVDDPIDSQRERELIKDLVHHGHPDVSGLLKALSDRRNAPKAPQRRSKYT